MTNIAVLDFSAESDLKPVLWEKLQERLLAKNGPEREEISFDELSAMHTNSSSVPTQSGTINREPEHKPDLGRSL